jgi:hypothetical protein
MRTTLTQTLAASGHMTIPLGSKSGGGDRQPGRVLPDGLYSGVTAVIHLTKSPNWRGGDLICDHLATAEVMSTPPTMEVTRRKGLRLIKHASTVRGYAPSFSWPEESCNLDRSIPYSVKESPSDDILSLSSSGISATAVLHLTVVGPNQLAPLLPTFHVPDMSGRPVFFAPIERGESRFMGTHMSICAVRNVTKVLEALLHVGDCRAVNAPQGCNTSIGELASIIAERCARAPNFHSVQAPRVGSLPVTGLPSRRVTDHAFRPVERTIERTRLWWGPYRDSW